ncbi:MAG TPA: hypothetical protein PKE00_03175 [Planctomycetota bacterium]|nr:hypothetical protein [Planctomycetota bacterium]
MKQQEGHDPSKVEYDFETGSSEVLEYGTVRPGTYLCRVDEARPGFTREGHKRWGLKYVVHEGPDVGRIAAWDGLTFSPKAAGRTKQVLQALGLPHEGTVRIHAEDLLGRVAFVTVELGEYRNPTTGQVVRRNKVPYGGVAAAESGSGLVARGLGTHRGADENEGENEDEDEDEVGAETAEIPF